MGTVIDYREEGEGVKNKRGREQVKFFPTQKKRGGGGAEQVLAMLKGAGRGAQNVLR